MQPLPYTDSVAKAVFLVLIGIFAAGELRMRVRTRHNQAGGTEERRSLIEVVAFVYLGLIGAFLFASKVEGAAIGFARWPVFLAGAILTAAGVAYRQWAIAVLGRWFTVTVRVSGGQSVVESGPYRRVAHPAYTGMIMTFVGIGLMLGNWLSLACLALLPTIGLLLRIRVEERALGAGIGEPYRRFLAGRARLIPGIW